MSHPIFTLLCALLVACVMAAMENRTPRERGWVAARTFVYCVAAVIAGSWLMHAVHG
ncbi:MAG TPA: hypothetical protein VMJ75_01880 [Candidatus Acidoferrales bacterium]|nr:hypothetical protein [Candidatus Acidoferrales bacterium]